MRYIVLSLSLVAGCDPSFEGTWTGELVESGQLSVTGPVAADGTADVERIAHSNTTSNATAVIRQEADDHVVSLPDCEFRARKSTGGDELLVDQAATCTVETGGHSFTMALFGSVRLGGDERLFVDLTGASMGSGQSGGVSWSFEGTK